MLPLHGQDTAAVKSYSLGRLYPPYGVLAGGDVFGKQAGPNLPSSFSLFLGWFSSCGGSTVGNFVFRNVFCLIILFSWLGVE